MKKSNEKSFHLIAGVVFTIVALVHLSRIIFGFSVIVGDWSMPIWINALGVLITGYLGYLSFKLR